MKFLLRWALNQQQQINSFKSKEKIEILTLEFKKRFANIVR